VAIFVGKRKENNIMKNIFFKPTLKNLSQGARLEYVRKLRHLEKEDVAEYLGLGGERPERTIARYENNDRVPSEERLEELAELYDVNINAIKEYKDADPLDTVYRLMWMEEEFPYFELDLNCSTCSDTAFNMNVKSGINEWLSWRTMRANNEISCEKYLEWILHFDFKKRIY
jgi:transcriptional regulator with XRE-family HTH domain